LLRSQANRYAKWAASAALGLTAVVIGVFAFRSWQRQEARKEFPPPVPQTVQKQSAEFSFSKVEGERTLFTVRASQATEFKEGGRSRLRDVWITIFGRAGKRFDNIHTRECSYLLTSGRIQCAGDVQMDLESAVEARERPGQRTLHVTTRNILFERESGEAYTSEPVEFRFPYGSGRGTGMTYSTRKGIFRMQRDVSLTLASRGPAGEGGVPVEMDGSALEYEKATSTMHLLGPARVRQQGRELLAGTLALEFDEQLRAKRLTATGAPRFSALGAQHAAGRPATLAGDTFVATFHPDGWTERVTAEGNVRGTRPIAGGEDVLTAHRVEIECEAGKNQPREIRATGDVRLESRSRNESRRLETAALLVGVAEARRGRRIARATTMAPGTVEWTSGEESTRVRAAQIQAEFLDDNRIHRLAGSNGVEIERRLGNRAAQLTEATELAMEFDPSGHWTSADLRGAVRYREGQRTAESDVARIERASEQTHMSGSVVVADRVSRTAAGSLQINQRTGEIRGTGGVHTSYLAREREGITDLAPQPAHITAETLTAGRENGRALYAGKARLWQGDAVIQAAEIELHRSERRLDARGGVSALFPETPEGNSGGGQLWRVQSARLSYFSAEGRARLEEKVRAESSRGRMQADRLDLFLSPPEAGARQLLRADAAGRASVQQGQRRGEAERAEYDATQGKFVLSGGTPTLFEAARGATTGRKLTFFLADDRILVESEAGSRTLTRHRVEK